MTEPTTKLYEVFAARPGGGSLAAVILSPQALSAVRMQAIASDLGAATTGFVALGGPGRTVLPIRFFTPLQEIDACGYVTLAAAAALRDSGHWTAPGRGTLTAGGGEYELSLTTDAVRVAVPVHHHRELDAAARGTVASALGLPLNDDLPCEVVTTGLRHLIVPVATAAHLAAFGPDRATAERLGQAHAVETIGLFAGHADVIHLRDLCAPIGDLEEPASGTTAAAVADFAHRHRGTTQLEIRQGEAMGRPSVLRTRIRADRIVEVTGEARPVLTDDNEGNHGHDE